MNKKHTLFIVDDHQMFREGLKFLLAKLKNIEIIGEAENGNDFLKKIEKVEPELVLMDISMPELDGVHATVKAIQKYPDIKIIALSMFGDEQYYFKMLKSGVKGFVLKESGSLELEDAINSVLDGRNYFSEGIFQNSNLETVSKKNPVGRKKNYAISTREKEVLQLLCTGLSTTEIADKLEISKRTVEGHKQKLLTKTQTPNSVNLIMFAIKNKLVKL